jgi:hypothetical protein
VGAYDRGGTYTTGDYTNYVTSSGTKRKAATLGQTFDLGSGVTIKVVCRNGKTLSGDSITPGSEENNNTLGLQITYGSFKMIMASDIGGYNSGSYKDQESILAPDIGAMNVLYVDHHGSATSSNPTWVSTTNPQASIISCGNGNGNGHPDQNALNRLCADPGADNYIYQTELGAGGTIPSGRGRVANHNIWIKVYATNFTVDGTNYIISGAKGGEALAASAADHRGMESSLSPAAWPNPARSAVSLSYQLPQAGTVRLAVYNALGQKIRELVDARQDPGHHSVIWNGLDGEGHQACSGLYFYRLECRLAGTDIVSANGKILMIR